jgi:hypothetical protein
MRRNFRITFDSPSFQTVSSPQSAACHASHEWFSQFHYDGSCFLVDKAGVWSQLPEKLKK